ncbi:MAG: HAMP domain-containing protein [Nitrospirae bacterium]|uniref:HD domain-containing phosphohydrolase n=1 Tax=Candidatus Magnetobacterium casense TaxID=1455061 RepID=UPI0006983AE2|nr:HD domain-containing phosphohydrolase [Candidatus Magnetobacterium casensis]MBF0336666.1 HAMP domain-containing protein [Nitrospirota bacterium]
MTVAVGIVMIVVAIVTAINISIHKATLEDELNTHRIIVKEAMKDRANDLADTLTTMVEEALVTGGISGVTQQMEKYIEAGKDTGEPAYIILMNNDSTALIHTLKSQLRQTKLTEKEDAFAIAQHQRTINEFTKDENEYMELIVAVNYASKPWGVLRIGYSNKKLNQMIKSTQHAISLKTRELVIRSLLVAIVSIIISAIIALIFSGRLLAPLTKLTKMVEGIAKGDFSAAEQLSTDSNDEIGMLARNFVEITSNLKSSHEQLEQYTKATEIPAIPTTPAKTIETDAVKPKTPPVSIKSAHVHAFIALNGSTNKTNAPVDATVEFNDKAAGSIFEDIDAVYASTEHLFKRIGTQADIQSEVFSLANTLMHACSTDTDIALGTLLIKQEAKYTIKHPLHTAIVCEIVAKKLGWSAQDRLSLLSAAITMNITIIELQEILYHQKTPLTDEQSAEIQSHPLEGMTFLKRNNVTDELWLNTVLQHHETIDGKGYPKGLAGGDVCGAARILYLADLYCAEITGRSYRRQLSPAVAVRDIFINKDQKFDENVAKTFMGTLGFYPPGSFVRLKNNDIAVVTQRGEKANAPIVHTVVKGDGSTPLTPLLRSTGIDEFSVIAIAPHAKVDRYRLWGYDVSKQQSDTKKGKRF